MKKFGVLVEIAVTPGKLEALRSYFKEFYEKLGQESGLECRHVMFNQDDPSKVFVFEVWEGQKDFENHLANEHSKKFAENIQGTYGPDGIIRTLTPFI